jgi:hypothetical protein
MEGVAINASAVDQPDGIILRGISLVSTARLYDKHDGSGQVVKVAQDILAGMSFTRIEAFLDPTDPRIRIEAGKVVEWPHLPKLAHVECVVERFGTDDGKLMIVREGRLLRIIPQASATFGVPAQ